MNPANNNTPDINFIPQEIVEKRREVASRSSNTKLAVTVLVIVLILSGVAFYFNNSVKSQISSLESQINNNQSKIDGLQDFGKHGYKLGLRLQNAKNIIFVRDNYSYLLEELSARVPDSVEISSIKASKGSMTFVGETKFGYTVIADLQSQLLQKNTEGKNLFEDVKLTSSKFNKSEGTIEFTLEIVLSNDIKEKDQAK